MITHIIVSYWIPRQRKTNQSYKFKEFAKIANFLFLKQTLHATHLLKLLDKMCKYEMDPMSIVEDTERTRFCPQTDRRTDGRTDRRTGGQGENSIPPFQLRWSGGYNNSLSPGRRQAIIGTNVGILLIWPLGTNFTETSIEIHISSFKKIHLKMSSKCWPFWLGINLSKSRRCFERCIEKDWWRTRGHKYNQPN